MVYNSIVAGYARRFIAVCVLAFVWLSAASAESATPKRVVSVGGSITEIIYALGEQERIAGVDTTSLWPEEARAFPQVGYQRNLSAEGVLSLTPDLVLATTDAGPPAVLTQIRDVGVPVVMLDNEPSAIGIARKIRGVARALGVEAAGDQLAEETLLRMETLRNRLVHVSQKPRVLFLLSIGRGAPLASGTHTAANGIIELAGGDNAIRSYDGYKPISSESVIAAAPDVILVTERTLSMLGGREKLLSIAGIATTPAGRNGRIIAMDALYLLGLGPRTPGAATELAAQLHPQLALAKGE